MKGPSSRDKFISASLENNSSGNVELFNGIMGKDMNLIPDYDHDLTYSAIIADKVVQHWTENLSDNTQIAYTKSLEQYCLFCTMTPAQLLKEGFMEKDPVPNLRRHIQRIVAFSSFLQKAGYELHHPDGTIIHKEYSPKALTQKTAAIRSFYAKFGIDIPAKV
ncbi:MAG: hypothetical protein R2741_02445 [Methanolobus sp.]